MGLSEKIVKNHDYIRKYLYLGYVNWDALIERIRSQESNPNLDCIDEQIWTFLVACGYAIDGPPGLKKLCSILTGRNDLTTEKIWIEVLPSSPRVQEGATHLDLVVGDIKLRNGKVSGIELKPKEDSWISFCEMKWYSDISYNVSYDLKRNQLARVIENALLIEKDNNFAENVFVNLVTPKIFKNAVTKSRFYCYKFEEYQKQDKLINDLRTCSLEYANELNTSKIEERVSSLKLIWTTFDSLFESLPESEISAEIKNFERNFNKTRKAYL